MEPKQALNIGVTFDTATNLGKTQHWIACTLHPHQAIQYVGIVAESQHVQVGIELLRVKYILGAIGPIRNQFEQGAFACCATISSCHVQCIKRSSALFVVT